MGCGVSKPKDGPNGAQKIYEKVSHGAQEPVRVDSDLKRVRELLEEEVGVIQSSRSELKMKLEKEKEEAELRIEQERMDLEETLAQEREMLNRQLANLRAESEMQLAKEKEESARQLAAERAEIQKLQQKFEASRIEMEREKEESERLLQSKRLEVEAIHKHLDASKSQLGKELNSMEKQRRSSRIGIGNGSNGLTQSSISLGLASLSTVHSTSIMEGTDAPSRHPSSVHQLSNGDMNSLPSSPMQKSLHVPLVRKISDVGMEGSPVQRIFSEISGASGEDTSPGDYQTGDLMDVTRLGVTLEALARIRDMLVEANGEKYEMMTTRDVVDTFVKPRTISTAQGSHCRLAEVEEIVGPNATGVPHYFVCHVWCAPIKLVLDTVLNFLSCDGSKMETRVWLDWVAVNQHSEDEAGHDQNTDDIQGCEEVLRLCKKGTIVCADMKTCNPASRVWCLFEWEATLRLHGVNALHFPLLSTEDRAVLANTIDVENSKCHDSWDKETILLKICLRYNQYEQFNHTLKCFLMLTPQMVDTHMMKHRERSSGQRWSFKVVQKWFNDKSHRALCITAEAGVGKSGVVSQIVHFMRRAHPEVLVCTHFLKFNDGVSLEPCQIIKNLAHQLARLDPVVREKIVELDAQFVVGCPLGQTSYIDNLVNLVLKHPLEQTGFQVVIVVDGLDEADPLEQQQHKGFTGCPLAAGNKFLQLLKQHLVHLPERVRFIFTARPDTACGRLKPLLHHLFSNHVTYMHPDVMWDSDVASASETGLKLYYTVLKECQLEAPKNPSAKITMEDVYGLYKQVFDQGMSELNEESKASVVFLVEMLLASYVPLSLAQLARMGFEEQHRLKIPGWGSLFFVVGQQVHMLHKSLSDWLYTESWEFNIARGHLHLAQHHNAMYRLNSFLQPTSYCVKYLLEHLSNAEPEDSNRDQLLDSLVLDLTFLANVIRTCNGSLAIRSLSSLGNHHTKFSEDVLNWLMHDVHRLEAKLHKKEQTDLQVLLSSAKRITPLYSTFRSHLRKEHFRKDDDWLCIRVIGQSSSCSESTWTSTIATFEGHKDVVTSVCFSPDARQVVSASADWTLRVWDTKAHYCRLVLVGHNGTVNAVDFSADGHTLVSGSEDKSVRTWDIVTGTGSGVLQGHTAEVNSVLMSLDSKKIVSASTDTTVKIWDAKTHECLNTLEVSSMIFDVGLTSDGTRIATCGLNNLVRLWNIESGECFSSLRGHDMFVHGVSLASDMSGRAVSGSADSTIKIWDTDRGDCLSTLEGHIGLVWSVNLSHDGKRIVSGSADWTVRVWNSEAPPQQACITTLKGHSDQVRSARVSKTGSNVVSGSFDRTVKLWNIENPDRLTQKQGHFLWVNGVVMNERMIVSGSHDQTLKTWDVKTGELINTLEGHTGAVWCVALSLSGSKVVSGSQDKTVKLWDLSTQECVLTMKGHTSQVVCVAISNHGRRIFSGSVDQTLRVWDSKTGQQVYCLKGHHNVVRSVSLSPDGSRIVSASADNTVKVWNSDHGICTTTLKGHSGDVSCAIFIDEGNQVVSGGADQRVILWDVDTGSIMCTFQGHQGFIRSLSVDRNEKYLVSGGYDELVKVWDLNTRECVFTLEGHSGRVRGVAINPSGNRIVSAGEDCTIRLWENIKEGISRGSRKSLIPVYASSTSDETPTKLSPLGLPNPT